VNVQGEIYLGFVTDPGLVLRAVVNSEYGHRAEVVEYTLPRNATPHPLVGETTPHTVVLESSGTADMLSINVRVTTIPPRGMRFGILFGHVRRGHWASDRNGNLPTVTAAPGPAFRRSSEPHASIFFSLTAIAEGSSRKSRIAVTNASGRS